MKRLWKKGIALTLTAVLGLSLAACGNGDSTTNNPSGDGTGEAYVYVPEFVTLETKEGAHLSSPTLHGDRLYYSTYTYNEETGESSSQLNYRMLSDINSEKIMSLPEMEIEGYETNMGSFVFDDEGNMYTIWTVYPVYEEGEDYDYNDQTLYLAKYDSNLNQIYSQDIGAALTDEMNRYVQNLVVDKNGKIYGSSNNVIHVFSSEGTFEKSIPINTDWINDLLVTADGRIFASYYGMQGVELVEIDTATGTTGATFTNIPDMNGSMKGGSEGKILVSGFSKLYEYDLATQESTEVLNWVDSNIDGNNVRDFTVLEDGRIVAYCDNYNGASELAYLTKTEASQVAQKEIITLATLYESNIQEAVVNFNKSNNQYQIKMKAYIDDTAEWTETTYTDAIARFNADIVGSDSPDIFDLSSLDWKNLASKGALEDLTPYMEASTIANTKDFVPSVLAAYNVDGKQLTVPASFMINTMMGKSSLVGSEPGWTLEDVMALADAHPEASLMRYVNKENALSLCLQYNSESFIDYENGTCSFDSPEFIQVLEFANRFDAETNYDDISFPTQIQSGQILLANVSFMDVQEYQMYHLMFEEEATCIGYPTFDGSPGVFLQGYETYGISAKSEHKEGAWKFIESILAEDEQEHIWQFPSRISALEDLFADAMEPEYTYDENGDILKDENGNPVQEPKTTWGYDDWEAKIYAATQEEIDALKGMIEIARPAGNNDQTILSMILEDVTPYFEGQKSAQEVAKIVQSRLEIYISENS